MLALTLTTCAALPMSVNVPLRFHVARSPVRYKRRGSVGSRGVATSDRSRLEAVSSSKYPLKSPGESTNNSPIWIFDRVQTHHLTNTLGLHVCMRSGPHLAREHSARFARIRIVRIWYLENEHPNARQRLKGAHRTVPHCQVTSFVAGK